MEGFPPPDFLADETNAQGLVVAAVVTVVIGAFFVALRIYTRAFVVRTLGPSDWAILVALLFSIGNSAGSIEQVQLGSIGRHFWTIPPDTFLAGMKTVYFTNLSYIASLVTVKISILLLYLRILSPIFLHRLCYGALGLVILFGLYSFITNILQCIPIAAFWDPFSYPDRWCFPNPPKYWIDIGVHLFTEVMILLLPMPFLTGLNIPLRRKIGVMLLFGFGIIVIIVSACRIPSIVQIGYSTDPSWDATYVSIWSGIELNTAITCACCMTLKPLVSRFFPRLFSHGYRYQSSVEDVHQGHHHHGHHRNGNHPSTIGTRRERPMPTDVALETIDDMPKLPASKASNGSLATDSRGTMSPLPMSPQRATMAV